MSTRTDLQRRMRRLDVLEAVVFALAKEHGRIRVSVDDMHGKAGEGFRLDIDEDNTAVTIEYVEGDS